MKFDRRTITGLIKGNRTIAFTFSLALSLALIATLFQNCENVKSFSSQSPLKASGGNGEGYEGMVYVQRGTCGEDPNAARARILIVKTQNLATLLTKECQNIVPTPLPMSQIVFAVDQTSLVYAGERYSYESGLEKPIVKLLDGQATTAHFTKNLGSLAAGQDYIIRYDSLTHGFSARGLDAVSGTVVEATYFIGDPLQNQVCIFNDVFTVDREGRIWINGSVMGSID